MCKALARAFKQNALIQGGTTNVVKQSLTLRSCLFLLASQIVQQPRTTTKVEVHVGLKKKGVLYFVCGGWEKRMKSLGLRLLNVFVCIHYQKEKEVKV